jgi:hypothetical protein
MLSQLLGRSLNLNAMVADRGLFVQSLKQAQPELRPAQYACRWHVF